MIQLYITYGIFKRVRCRFATFRSRGNKNVAPAPTCTSPDWGGQHDFEKSQLALRALWSSLVEDVVDRRSSLLLSFSFKLNETFVRDEAEAAAPRGPVCDQRPSALEQPAEH